MTETRRIIGVTLTAGDLERLNEWTPCTRIRLVNVDGEMRRLEIDTRATCGQCKGAGTWERDGIRMRCKYCRGTGLH